ncbi:hypothetical protein QC764_0058420 [Podospora pseudoanserina]|uniref:Uncharacterized protein n=1 Tax=Podospora pseudoanserina TaxID=2609844 RepID=A0ABR0IF87_9PEZI|nr:hypothetical protein QC764_0058420 [Podospora pseudoanserina]
MAVEISSGYRQRLGEDQDSPCGRWGDTSTQSNDPGLCGEAANFAMARAERVELHRRGSYQ